MDLNEDSEGLRENVDRDQSLKDAAGRRGGPRFEMDARSKGSTQSKEKRIFRKKSTVKEKSLTKPMYHTANDGFYRK